MSSVVDIRRRIPVNHIFLKKITIAQAASFPDEYTAESIVWLVPSFKCGQRGLVLKNYPGDLSQSEKAKYFEWIVKTYILYFTAQAPI